MDGRQKKYLFIIIAALLAVFFTSCRSSTPLSEANTEALRDLGDAMVSDLQRKILPNRETPDELVNYGYVVSKGDVSDGIDAIAEFFVSYEGGNNSEVTMIFTDGSFVVARVVFIDGTVYYMRYEYDKASPDEINVIGQAVEKVNLKYTANPPKWEMTLKMKNRQTKTFLLKNPVKRDYRLQDIQ